MSWPWERRCENCSEFLKDKKTLEIPCKQCGTQISWPPESQLQTHLGAWAEPSLCGACKRDAIEAARAAERIALRNAHPTPGETPQPVVEATEPAKDETPVEPTPPLDPASHGQHLVLLFVIAFVTLAALVAMMLLHP